jgi:hypothetical protein
LPRRICLVCGKPLEKTELKAKKWSYLHKRSYFSCEGCKRTWLYSPDLTCPVLLEHKS